VYSSRSGDKQKDVIERGFGGGIMDRPTREALGAQLHAELVSHMGALTRLAFLVSGSVPDPLDLVKQMEIDLERQCERIGKELSLYSAADLKVRKDIARQVVARIRTEVTTGRVRVEHAD